MSVQLSVGDIAPEFSLPDALGNIVSLSDFANQQVVVYFYPAAGTPGCTREAVDFSDNLDIFTENGYQIVGISPDKGPKLQKFVDNHSLRIKLLADPEHKAIAAYGAWGPRDIFGKTIYGVLRSTFVVDVSADGMGKITLAQYSVRSKGHVDRLKRDLSLEI